MPAAPPDQPRCGAQRSGQPRGVLCTQVAGWGTDHVGVGRCKRHGGNTPAHREGAKAEYQRLVCDRLGIPVEVDPGDALIHAVWEAAGNVEFYRSLVAEMQTHPTKGKLVETEDGERFLDQGTSGIYGPTYHQSGIPTGEAKPNILVVLYNDERDRLASYAKAALQANVDERRVRMAEADARMLFGAVAKAMAKVKMTPEQTEVFRAELADALRNPEPALVAS